MTSGVRAPDRFLCVLACVMAATHFVATHPRSPQSAGSGLIAGMVVSADAPPHPIARTIVTLSSRELTRDREAIPRCAARARETP